MQKKLTKILVFPFIAFFILFNISFSVEAAAATEWGYYTGQCVWYAAKCLRENLNINFTNYYENAHFGDGWTWAKAGASIGIRVDEQPAVGSIACWDRSPGNMHGHVAYVSNVTNNIVTIEEYNWDNPKAYGKRTFTINSPKDPKQYIHFEEIGFFINDSNNTQTSTPNYCNTIYDGIDYSPVYDFECYLQKNPDIENAFGRNPKRVLQHFVCNGMSEGRIASESFDVHFYRTTNIDLNNAYSDDMKAYYLHYINRGQIEGRCGVQATIYDGIDYSPVYDFECYLQKNPDIENAFGRNPKRVLQHFVCNGMSEGRIASESFDVHFYRTTNIDLNNAYSDDMKAYYLHYINRGQIEGRCGSR